MEKKSAPPQTIPIPEEIQKIFGQAVFTGLAALVLFSLSYSYFVWKQNRELQGQLAEFLPQAEQARHMEDVFRSFVNDLSVYSQQHPDVVEVLMRNGLPLSPQQQQQQAPPPGIPGELPPMPPPPPAR